MKKSILAVTLFAVLAVFAFAKGSQQYAVATKPAASAQAADKAAIAALWKAYSQAVIDHNAGAYLALHDRGAYKMPQNQPMFKLWAVADKIRAKFAKGAAEYTTVMRINPKETVIMGDYAYSMGTYYKADTPKAGGDPIVTDGKFLTILHKDSAGDWKIIRDCYNSNVPPK